VRDVAATAEFLSLRLPEFVADISDHAVRLHLAKTWGCEYRFTDRVLTGDPRG
jgi:hypothetical protein